MTHTSDRTGLLGAFSGLLLAPWTALGSYLRRTRLFHPTGLMLRGELVLPPTRGGDEATICDHNPHRALGERLQGKVVVRFSSAFWKGREWPDVLGCAVRCSGDGTPPTAAAKPTDQDLLFATVRHPLTTLLASITTDVSDYLSNDYYAVSPFTAPAYGRIKLRLVSMACGGNGVTREAKLLTELERIPLLFQLEAKALHERRYRPVALLELKEHIDDDQEEWRFDPFLAGRGLEPVGFVQNLRRAAYAASRRGRSARHSVARATAANAASAGKGR
jgi:hypothetical protein